LSSKRQGFSQVEILIAVAVLTVGILGVCATFAFALRAETQAGALTDAVTHARTLTELVRVQNLPFSAPAGQPGLYDSAGTRRPLNYAPFADKLPADTIFTRNILIERRSGATPATAYLNNIARITVSVYWNDHGTERKVTLVSEHRQP